MWRLIGARLTSLVVTLLVASVAIYGALFLAPGDPATLLAGGHATPAVLAAIERAEHLNEPFFTRYWDWLVGRAPRQSGPVLRLPRTGHHVAVGQGGEHHLPGPLRLDPDHCRGPHPGRRGGAATARGHRHHRAHQHRTRHAVVRRGHPADHGLRRQARVVPGLRRRQRLLRPALAPHAAGGRPGDLVAGLHRAADQGRRARRS